MAERESRRRGAERRRERTSRRRSLDREQRLPFERSNWLLFGAALVVIVIGYVVLAAGDITLAPFLLVVGYCILVPLAIIYRSRAAAGRASSGSGE